MNSYESRIDPTTFGTIAGHLRDPLSPVHYLVHVRERARLATLAEQLEPVTVPGDIAPAGLASLLASPLMEGAVRLSSGRPIELPDPQQLLAASSVPRLARCEVIYLPPFYLVHTPGLFEGTLVKAPVVQEHPAHEHALRPHRFKL